MFGQTVEQKTYQPESVALPFRTRRPHVQFPLESTAEEVRSGSLVHDAGKQRNFPLVNADGEVVQSKDSQTVEKEVSDPKDAAQSKSDVEHPTSATARTSPSGAEQSSFDEGKSGFLASRKRFKVSRAATTCPTVCHMSGDKSRTFLQQKTLLSPDLSAMTSH